ncbi:MAG TPA: Co2+/Mg2+ efflux protein ApaG [Gemmatimonadales bacterium]|nr:Co2+/Mg2+ efflux protein ApaG [Gemmatimonadales bacterium]
MQRPMKRRPFFYRQTNAIRITVRPQFLAEHSDPARARYVFAYFVRIENVGGQPAKLVARHWRIHDSIGQDHEVEGPGIIGEQPVIAPGRVHEYRSFCELKSPGGYMEGEYHFVRADGAGFDAAIPRFTLVADGEDG